MKNKILNGYIKKILFLLLITIFIVIIFRLTEEISFCLDESKNVEDSVNSKSSGNGLNSTAVLKIGLITSGFVVLGLTAGWTVACFGGVGAILVVGTIFTKTKTSQGFSTKEKTNKNESLDTDQMPSENPIINIPSVSPVVNIPSENPIINIPPVSHVADIPVIPTPAIPLYPLPIPAVLQKPGHNSSLELILKNYDRVLNDFMHEPFVTKFLNPQFYWGSDPFVGNNLDRFFGDASHVLPPMNVPYEVLNLNLVLHILAIMAYNCDIAAILKHFADFQTNPTDLVLGVHINVLTPNMIYKILIKIITNLEHFQVIANSPGFNHELNRLAYQSPEMYRICEQQLREIPQRLEEIRAYARLLNMK